MMNHFMTSSIICSKYMKHHPSSMLRYKIRSKLAKFIFIKIDTIYIHFRLIYIFFK